MKKTVTVGTIVVALMLLGGCLTFFQQSPRYIEGTSLEIRTDSSGENYVAEIGNSKTTAIEAILNGNGYYSIAYSYTDTQWLLVNRFIIETDCCTISVDSREPIRKDNGAGIVTENDRIEVRRALFEQMLESDTPVIIIEGDQGTVIIEMGSSSKKNLQELLDYGEERLPEG